jgi:hypothetical protein
MVQNSIHGLHRLLGLKLQVHLCGQGSTPRLTDSLTVSRNVTLTHWRWVRTPPP